MRYGCVPIEKNNKKGRRMKARDYLLAGVVGVFTVWGISSVGCSGTNRGLTDGGVDAAADGGVWGSKIAENTDELCRNGKDDDGNGFKDCYDKGCLTRNDAGKATGVSACIGNEPEDTPEKCSDGIDNDGNGYIDCADFSCTKGDAGVLNPNCELTDTLCGDGVDNDGNGYTDCKDKNCAKSAKCLDGGVPENTNELCSDGLDNDNDGYVDCADYDCSKNANVSVCKDAGTTDAK